MMRAMPDLTSSPSTNLPPDRAEALVLVRAELRDNHPRLTERQIDLIADVAVDLRLTQARLGLQPGPTLPESPARVRVPARAGPA
jgi:hypothetical protein